MQIDGTEIDFTKQRGYFFNMDCMKALKQMPDKSIDLAIVDPIYGDVTGGGYTTSKWDNKEHHIGKCSANERAYHRALWDMPKTPPEYFKELFRVSKNQIIWGGNFFVESLPSSQGWVVWDKQRPEGVSFSDCELAFTSFNVGLRIFRFMWNGMLQGDMKNKECKIHPTQKPVALYKWLLHKYANEDDIILDTHAGSASSLIACHLMGYNYIGFEIDDVYYKKAKERLERETAQMTIFDLMGGTE